MSQYCVLQNYIYSATFTLLDRSSHFKRQIISKRTVQFLCINTIGDMFDKSIFSVALFTEFLCEFITLTRIGSCDVNFGPFALVRWCSITQRQQIKGRVMVPEPKGLSILLRLKFCFVLL